MSGMPAAGSGKVLIASPDAIKAIPKGSKPLDIARRLRVRYVVSGNLELVGSNLKLSLKLFDSKDVNGDWTREIQNIPVQEMIYTAASSLMNEIGLKTPEGDSSFTNPEAYKLYLRAKQNAAATELSDEAELLYRQAIEIDSRFAPALAGLCRIHLSRYNLNKNILDFQSAEQFCFRAWTIDAQSIEVKRSLASLYYYSGQISKARELYEEALASHPYDYLLKTLIAKTYVDDNPDLAEAILKQLIQQHPGSPEAYVQLQYLYYKQGRYKLAVVEFEKAVQILADPVIYEHLGDVYFKLGNIMKAKESWQKALEIEYREDSKLKEKLEQIKIE